MNVGRVVLGMVVLLAVGVMVLPSTVSLFAGQHNWYNISAAGNQIPCEKCHADIKTELSNSAVHESFSCADCHRANASITYASGPATAGKEAHAASTVACMLCHQFNSSGAYVNETAIGIPPIAGGFNVSGASGYETGPNAVYNYTNSSAPGLLAAHNDFVKDAINSSFMEDSNEACIACHTHVAVQVNFTHYKAMEFNVSINNAWLSGTSIIKWNVNGFRVNTSTAVTYTIWGNATGNGTTTYGSIDWPGNHSANWP